jgi:hypothetical protein
MNENAYEDQYITIQVYSLLPCMPLSIERIPYFDEDADWSDSRREVNLECKRLQELGVVFYRDDQIGTPAIDVEPHEDFDAFYSHFVIDADSFKIVSKFVQDRPCRVHWKYDGVVRRDFTD